MDLSPLPERAEQIRALFREVVDLGPEERASRLDQVCRDDADLHREVDALLAVSDSRYADICQDLDELFHAPGDEADSLAEALIGRRVSHYEVAERLGGGGMGAVYKAHDSHLDRTVALKFLPTDLTRDPEARDRFIHEARAASALDHVNICTIYETGETDGGRTFIAMACYDGKTLKAKIERGPLPLDEAIGYTLQVAEGLKKAHTAGIIHRDVKPANVIVTKDGVVKIVDFGLAKVRDVTLTQTGRTLGTVAYMSPEQAQGKAVDARTDIWSLGVVLYEMVVGRRPFRGGHEQSVIHAILHEEPEPPTGLRTGIPLALEGVVLKCLAKDPEDRYQHVEEIPVDLRAIDTKPSSVSEKQSGRFPTAFRMQRSALRWKVLAGLMAVLAVAAVLALWSSRRASPPPQQPTGFFAVPLPQDQSLQNVGFFGSAVAISPDGTKMIYVARQDTVTRLFLRSIDALESYPIPGTEGARVPFFSPDGQWVGFYADGQLKKVLIQGGSPEALADISICIHGGHWGPDRTILFSQLYIGLERVSDVGGSREVITRRLQSASGNNPGGEHFFPQLLPGGEWVLFTLYDSYEDMRIVVRNLQTGEQRTVIKRGTAARYLPTRHVIYALDGNLLAAPFDLKTLQLTAAPVPVLEGVLTEKAMGVAHFDVSKNGTLVYLPGEVLPESERTLVWVDPGGAEEPLSLSVGLWTRRVSPDGKRTLVSRPYLTGVRPNLWVSDLESGMQRWLTDEAGGEFWAEWTADGKRVVFNSNRHGGTVNLYWMPWDGSGPAERLTESENHQAPSSVSADGQVLAYVEVGQDFDNFDIWTLPLEGERTPRPFLQTPHNEIHPAFSPDGRWLAYASDVSGSYEVYVQPYPGLGGRIQVSTEGGWQPLWSPDGRTLHYRHANKMLAVPVQSGPDLVVEDPRVLFAGRYVIDAGNWGRTYDITPDGTRFLMGQVSDPPPPPTQYHVVVNWFKELNRRVPTTL